MCDDLQKFRWRVFRDAFFIEVLQMSALCTAEYDWGVRVIGVD